MTRTVSALFIALVAAIICSAVDPAEALLLRGGGNGAVAYSDLCSQTNVPCVYAWSVTHRLNSTNTDPFQLTRTSDSAVFEASYTGSNFVVNVSAATTFCLANGGTTTTTATYTQYNDCTFTDLYDQKGTCNLLALETNKRPPFKTWLADGFPVIIQTTVSNGTVGATTGWLTGFGCSAVAGAAAKSLIFYTNSTYGSLCCGQFGFGENGSGSNPTRPIPIVSGSMLAQFWFTGSPVPAGSTNYNYDDEGGGGGGRTFVNSTPVSGVGVITYSGGTNLINDWFNNIQGDTNFTPLQTINTQSRVNLGCSGDLTSCGPYWFRDMAVTSNDVSAVGGLPTAIYTYLTNFYASI
jgi:hypothetical protein